MKRLLPLLLLGVFATNVNAVDYHDTVITGVGISAGDNHLRFTIDKDPYVILTTSAFSGEQLNRLAAMILAAYASQTPVKLVRSQESSSSTTLHYSDLAYLSLGTRTWD